MAGDRERGAPARPPSIALITSLAFSLPNFRGPLITALIGQGYKVYALAPDFEDAIRNAVRALGAEPIDISLDRTGLHPLRDFVDCLRLVRLLKTLRPDVTLNYFIKPVIYGGFAAWLAHVPRRFALVAGLGYAFTPDEQASPKRKLLQAAASGLYRAAFKRYDRVFLQNRDDLAQLVDSGMLAAGKAVLLNGSGIDLDRLRPAPAVTAPITFILVARLLREKGIPEFVAAAREVRGQFPQTRFILVGGTDPNPGGLSEGEVRAWAAGGIEWTGHVDDVPAQLAQASVFVLPSWREGKPRSTQEALAMARPVITTDAPGCRDTVIDGVNGFMVPVRDPSAIAAAMRRFIERPALIAQMGAASRRLAEERFDVHTINRTMLSAMGIAAPPSIAAQEAGAARVARD